MWRHLFIGLCAITMIACSDSPGATGGSGGNAGVGGNTAGAGGSNCTDRSLPALTVEEVVDDRQWQQPVFLTQYETNGDLYVVEQTGRILVVRNGAVLQDPFLDLSGLVSQGFEDGLLGLAFHPDYASNGRFFVFYTQDPTPQNDRRNVVAEYARATTDPPAADPNEVRRLVQAIEPLEDRDNHNGGMLEFGSDGFLYVGIGDGGSGGDPDDNGLDPTTLFGSILRLDVDAVGDGFAAAGNPFSATSDPVGLTQIYHYGLRNPWRFSFDRMTNDLYIGDVGQGAVEEISFAAAGASGLNFGWRKFEGNDETSFGQNNTLPTPHVPPIDTIRHTGDPDLGEVQSITGGYVYRGSAIAGLSGFYLFGDWGTNRIAAFEYTGGEKCNRQEVTDLNPSAINTALGFNAFGLSSFGEDASGELYVLFLGNTGGTNGRVLKIVSP